MPQIINLPAVKERRRKLRRNETFTERMLWHALRCIRIPGVVFHRQVSVKNFVLDFYVPQAKLAIEVDGESHDGAEAQEYDARRQRAIEGFGIEFMRFGNNDVMKSVDRVADAIEKRVRERLDDKKRKRLRCANPEETPPLPPSIRAVKRSRNSSL